VAAFNSNERRFDDKTFGQSLEIPGPGTYIETAKSTEEERKGLVKPFGSGLDRFKIKKPATDIPGPGQYKPEVSLKLLDQKAQDLTDQSAVFKTKTKRTTIEPDELPAVGQYFPEKYNSLGQLGRS
jgi:hypothetical protein